MNATILYFSEFGRATFVQGQLSQITELAFNAMSGFNTSSFEISLNRSGKKTSISTRLDFLVFNGTHNLKSIDHWKAFSIQDLQALASQIPSHTIVFKRCNWEYLNQLDTSLVSLQPTFQKVPESRQRIGDLIRKIQEEKRV